MKITPRVVVVVAVLLMCVAAIVPAGSAAASNVFDSPVPTVAPTPAPGNLGVHTVRAGESLYCIGRAYGISPWAIASTNGVPWPYTIFVGQALNIPNVPWLNIPAGPICVKQFGGGVPVPTPAPTSVPATPGPTPVPGTCVQSYLILPGDTLFGISIRFGVDIPTLAARNHIANINLIFAYTTICIR
ncbi:MAG TPA: LysM peptidoglycan-binding domain-containing protein [Anaerolineae bacterium]|nr:LysM peptidoglycan-binding domain-containing protein [Anaerolineae bacterium]